MGSLWTTRVSNDGLLRSDGSPARAGVTVAPRRPRIISHGSVGFCEKKGFLRPGVRFVATDCRSRVLIPLLVPSHVEAGVGRVGAGCVYE